MMWRRIGTSRFQVRPLDRGSAVARIRTIKPEFFTSLTIADLTPEQRLTFIGLWTHVDDDGRCVDDPRLIKAAVWPLDDRTAADVEKDLRVLTESSLIARYTLKQKRYLAVTGWYEHQKINRPTESKLPAPEDGKPTPPTCNNDPSVNPHQQFSEDSPPERKGKERNREQGTSEIATRSDALLDRPEIDQICNRLADRIEANGSKRPVITKRWRDAARLMLDADHRTQQQIHAAIDWCQNHEFWRANILSMPKLREKYEQLSLQAQRPNNGSVIHIDRRQQATNELFDRAMARARAQDAQEAHGEP